MSKMPKRRTSRLRSGSKISSETLNHNLNVAVRVHLHNIGRFAMRMNVPVEKVEEDEEM